MMHYVGILLMVLLVSGCASDVVLDYNASAGFDRYQSWAFAASGDKGGPEIVSLDGTRVRAAVDRALKGHNMTQVEPGEADLLVNWRIVEEERLERQGVGLGLGFGSGHFGWGIASSPPVRAIEEGKLVVELVDTRTNEVVWRATSRRYLNETQSPETRRKLIDEVVAEMFSRYPPEQK
ncbi:MAG: DUF4136 domain-containing protein [Pseudomonadota bacterium]|nr:DUF4136 domain-containing protein [Pseudomonadota bacterium]